MAKQSGSGKKLDAKIFTFRRMAVSTKNEMGPGMLE
jgi:hypothetical protein